MKQPVEGYQNFYKDPQTGVIVNRETTERSRYRIAKAQAMNNIESQYEISELKREVKSLSGVKDEIEEIKELLKELLRKNIT